MSSPSQPNNDFTKRDELLAGRVLGNLSSEETELLAHEFLSAEEENLLIELKAAHSRMETHSAPALSAAVRERLLHSSRQKRTFNPQSWFIGVLLWRKSNRMPSRFFCGSCEYWRGHVRSA